MGICRSVRTFLFYRQRSLAYRFNRHLKYTIPFGLVLFAVYRPLLSKLDIFKLAFMITVRTIPPRLKVLKTNSFLDSCCVYNVCALRASPLLYADIRKAHGTLISSEIGYGLIHLVLFADSPRGIFQLKSSSFL